MNRFDERYQELRRNNQPGWAGKMHARSMAMDRARLDNLAAQGLFSIPRGRAVELGCGNGVALFSLEALGFEAFGIEISQTAVKWARERMPFNADRIICGSVAQMPFPNEFFQLAYDGACFHCVIGSERQRTLAEVRRTLLDDGIFVLSSMCGTPRKLPDGQRFDAESQLILDESGEPSRTIRPREELENEVVAAGFQIISGTINENPWWDHLSLVARRA